MNAAARMKLRVRSREAARDIYWKNIDIGHYECISCGTDENLEIHHRDGDWLHNHPINLVAVCHRCHKAEHRQRATIEKLQEWKEGFLAIGNDS